MASELQMTYRIQWSTIIGTIAFFTPCTAVLAHKAATSEASMVLDGVFRLSPAEARLFYWIAAGCAAAFVLLGALLALHRTVANPRITLDERGISIPRKRLVGTRSIAYGDITQLAVTSVGRQRFLTITHHGGRTHIAASMLPADGALDELLAALGERTGPTSP